MIILENNTKNIFSFSFPLPTHQGGASHQGITAIVVQTSFASSQARQDICMIESEVIIIVALFIG